MTSSLIPHWQYYCSVISKRVRSTFMQNIFSALILGRQVPLLLNRNQKKSTIAKMKYKRYYAKRMVVCWITVTVKGSCLALRRITVSCLPESDCWHVLCCLSWVESCARLFVVVYDWTKDILTFNLKLIYYMSKSKWVRRLEWQLPVSGVCPSNRSKRFPAPMCYRFGLSHWHGFFLACSISLIRYRAMMACAPTRRVTRLFARRYL